MRPWIVCGCAVLLLLLALADAQVSRRRQLEAKENWRETSSDNLIDIDLETERNNVDQGWQAGSGNGVDSTDDEDLMSSGSGSGDNVPDPSEVDRPPIANAGQNLVLYMPENNAVTLCGNASTDDRGIVSYHWVKKTHLLSADMTGTRSVCVKVSNLQIGDYTFGLVVTDSGGNQATAEVRVYVKPESGTVEPQTHCQQLRETSRHVYGTYVPRCTEDGDYESLQCRAHQDSSTCWCVDLGGREIPGTAMEPSNPPDCDEGTNLPPCVFMVVTQRRGRQLGAFTPRCNLEGLFQPVQCSGSMCYCVHTHSGVKVPLTEVVLPNQPVCDGSRKATTEKGHHDIKHKTTTSAPVQKTPAPEITTKINVNVDSEGVPTKKPDAPQDNKSGSSGEQTRTPSSAAHIMTQPGILAAIIGGSVVLLLCAVLLVMFVVYRMRKKDEGSYALDEPKKMPNYSYQRAPDKEFYA